MRKKLTAYVLDQKHKGVVEIRDADSPLVLRVQGSAKSLTVRTRLNGKTIRVTWPKAATAENLHDARQWAQKALAEAKAGIDPRTELIDEAERVKRVAARAETLRFEKIVETYMKRRVRGEKQNKTADEIERVFNLYVTPRWKDRNVREISRADVHALLDDISDGKIAQGDKFVGTPAVAANVLAQMRALFRWYEGRDDKFTNPIVSGMTRGRPSPRDRVLDDKEIRALWAVLPGQGLFGKLVKTLLLTAQRRDEVGHMVRSEIDDKGVWTIPASRYKTGKPNIVPLPKSARNVLESIDQVDECDAVFTLDGEKLFNGYSKAKRQLDEAMLAELRKTDPKAKLKPWRLHDLRRTAKTLMAKAGVRPDISERVLGHVIGGVEGVYDQHDYVEQKRHALEALGNMIERIVNPQANIVRLAGQRLSS